jgi:hypothetical protein
MERRILNFAVIWTIFSLVMTLTACVKEADIPLPQVDAKLVLHCFITDTTDTIRARVTWSKPVFASTPSTSFAFENATDLSIQISDGTTTKSLIYDEWNQDYKLAASEIGLSAGIPYTLVATHPNGQQIRAIASIPSSPITILNDELQIDSLVNQMGNTQMQYTFKTTLAGRANETLHYRFLYDAVIDTSMNWEYSYRIGEGFAESDGTIDPVYHEQTVTYFGDFEGPQAWTLFVVLGDEAYYRYHRSISSIGFEGPFEEPSLVYSNVEGGLGIFGGCRSIALSH